MADFKADEEDFWSNEDNFLNLIEQFEGNPNLLSEVKDSLSLLEDKKNMSAFVLSTIHTHVENLVGKQGSLFIFNIIVNNINNELEQINPLYFSHLCYIFAKYNTLYECAVKYIKNPLDIATIEGVGINRGYFKLVRADTEQLILRTSLHSLAELVESLLDRMNDIIEERNITPKNHKGLMVSFENYYKACGANDDYSKE